MTCILPMPNRFTTHLTRADEDAPGAATLPQVFKTAGYTTGSNGKVFHNSADARERSWSEAPSLSGEELTRRLDPATTATKSAAGRPLVYESPDVPDDAYGDGKIAAKTIADLQRLKTAGQPFFLACGFIRPHLPFYAPKKYWDLYDREKIVLAENRRRPADAPAGLKGSGEYRTYAHGEYQDGTDAFHRMMRHGYYASTSYVDQLVGNVLAALTRLGLAENTIVVLWGDHGWNLGEHDFWGKHNTLNTAVRVPLIVKVPGRIAGQKSAALVGVYDLFPTLCSLANLPVPATVQGRSFAALLADPKQKFRDSVYTRYGKGDAVVTDRWIYTRYADNDGEMLYDLNADPAENQNLAARPAHASTLAQMRAALTPSNAWPRKHRSARRSDRREPAARRSLSSVFICRDFLLTRPQTQPRLPMTSPTLPSLRKRACALLLASACALRGLKPRQPLPLPPPARGSDPALGLLRAGRREPRWTPSETLTGSRVATKIIDLPYTVNVMTSEFLEDFGIFELSDNIVQIGGFTGLDVGGQFNLRGFNSTSQLRDGFFRLGRYGSSNVDRLEIIKGSNAAIYGGTSPGGMLNMISKQPKTRESQKLTFNYGDDGTERVTLEATGPLLNTAFGQTGFILTGSHFQKEFDMEYARNRNEEYYLALTNRFNDGATLFVSLEYFLQRRDAPNQSAVLITDLKGTASNLDDEAIGYATNLARINPYGPNSKLDRGNTGLNIFYDRLNATWSTRFGANRYWARRWDYNQNTGWGALSINPARAANGTLPPLTSARGATPNTTRIIEDGGGFQGDLLAHYWTNQRQLEHRTLVTVDVNDYYSNT